jgi:hypothetical protein
MKLSEHIKDEKICAQLYATVDKLSDEYELSPHIIEDLLIAEAFPVDDRRWPVSWVKGKRFENILSSLDQMYITSFGSCYPSNVKKVIDQWNVYAAMPAERLRRIFEKERVSFRVKKVYVRSRYLKDMYVILYLLKSRRVSVRDLIRTTVVRIKDLQNNLTPRVVWKWNKFGTDKSEAVEDSKDISRKVKMIETGDE